MTNRIGAPGSADWQMKWDNRGHQRNGPPPNITAHKRLHEKTSEGRIWARFRWYAERRNKRVKQWWTRDSCCLTTQRQGEVPHLWSRTQGAWVPHPVIFNCRSDRFELVRETRLRFTCLGALTREERSGSSRVSKHFPFILCTPKRVWYGSYKNAFFLGRWFIFASLQARSR